jgi:hypothetical protein
MSDPTTRIYSADLDPDPDGYDLVVDRHGRVAARVAAGHGIAARDLAESVARHQAERRYTAAATTQYALDRLPGYNEDDLLYDAAGDTLTPAAYRAAIAALATS